MQQNFAKPQDRTTLHLRKGGCWRQQRGPKLLQKLLATIQRPVKIRCKAHSCCCKTFSFFFFNYFKGLSAVSKRIPAELLRGSTVPSTPGTAQSRNSLPNRPSSTGSAERDRQLGRSRCTRSGEGEGFGNTPDGLPTSFTLPAFAVPPLPGPSLGLAAGLQTSQNGLNSAPLQPGEQSPAPATLPVLRSSLPPSCLESPLNTRSFGRVGTTRPCRCWF